MLRRRWATWQHAAMKAYSKDLRRKIVNALGRGMSKAEAARIFGVGISRPSSVTPPKPKGESPWSQARHLANVPRWMSRSGSSSKRTSRSARSSPFGSAATLRRGHRRVFGEPFHYVSRHSSDRFHAQKGGRSATERDEFLRAAWRVMVAAEVDPERLVFLNAWCEF